MMWNSQHKPLLTHGRGVRYLQVTAHYCHQDVQLQAPLG